MELKVKCGCSDYEYLIFNTKTRKIACFDNGEPIFYAHKEEAEAGLNENEELLEIKLK